MRVLQTTDDDRRPRPWPSYTICKRVSNKLVQTSYSIYNEHNDSDYSITAYELSIWLYKQLRTILVQNSHNISTVAKYNVVLGISGLLCGRCPR